MLLINQLSETLLPKDVDDQFFQSDIETVKLYHLEALLNRANRTMLKLLNHSSKIDEQTFGDTCSLFLQMTMHVTNIDLIGETTIEERRKQYLHSPYL